MYDIKQFKPTLYVLVLMGLTGFAMAAEEPALWVLASAGILLNAWLVKTKRFVPMPRWLANGITLLAVVYVANQVLRSSGTPILLIGQFLVLLQLIKLYEQRSNRDYGQLLVLTVLLMVAGAISTPSLLFGLLFIAYPFVTLYCCLLFHLKVETDAAKKAQTLPEEKLNAATLRQDQRYLPRSMRRLTGLISVASLLTAVAVFLTFPRGTGAGMFGQLQVKVAEPLVGFSDHFGFQDVARITQSNEIVARVKVWKNDKLVQTGSLVLRGSTLERYENREWSHPPRFQNFGSSESDASFAPWSRLPYFPGIEQPETDQWKQRITLRPIGEPALFSMPGPTSLTSERELKIRYNARDQTLATVEPSPPPDLTYDVTSTNTLSGGQVFKGLLGTISERRAPIDPRIIAYAQRPEVCGVSNGKTLAEQRNPNPAKIEAVSPLDEEIAANIEKHLRSSFTYTLDLTGDRDLLRADEPMVVFLERIKKGHCEYFAGAMTLLCQSLGMQARVVTGFKSDEYSAVMGEGYFLVRQSHAHAWVEVLTAKGWQSFDPTSGTAAAAEHHAGAFASLKHLFDYMEYTWGNSVVAYDSGRRENLLTTVENKLTNTAIHNTGALDRWRQSTPAMTEWLSMFRGISPYVIGGLILAMVLGLVAAVMRFVVERWRIRRRAARIGLEGLPRPDQMRLARQLGFYEDMTRLLERQGIRRQRSQTPMEFSRSLVFLPSEAYDAIRRLTRIFYRVRFGRAEIQTDQQRRLAHVVARLATLPGMKENAK